MELITKITQHSLTQVQSTGEADSKIKLRKLSYSNLLECVKNIPYVMVQSQVNEEDEEFTQAIGNDPSKDEKTEKVIDFSEYVARLNNATQLITNTREEASIAQENAKISDVEVSKLGVEMSELEKQELEMEAKSKELDQQLKEAYMHQSQILELIRKEQERIMQEAISRQKENQEKASKIQIEIGNIRERITSKGADIARKQEILRALQQTEFSDLDLDINNLVDYPSTDTEEPVKKIA